jgi:formylglycine-generating enzyme required for sulfatase activity
LYFLYHRRPLIARFWISRHNQRMIPPAKVFISYTAQDPTAGALARSIHERLAEHGIASFLDLARIAPGREIDAAIRESLPDVETLIMVVSASCAASRWMMAECMYAFEHETPIIPVLAEPGVAVPFPFNRLRRLDFAQRFDEEWPELLALLRGSGAAASQPRDAGPSPAPPAGDGSDGAQSATGGTGADAIPVRGATGRPQQAPVSPLDEEGAQPVGPGSSSGIPHAGMVALGVLVAAVVAVGWMSRVLRPDDGGTVRRPDDATEGVARPATPVPQFVRVPEGPYLMGGAGRANELPTHTVRIPKPFYLSKTEITFDHFDAFAESTGRDKPQDRGWGRGDRPVIYVSWQDAQAYAEWLSEELDDECRLPSEAEWEYAARAGTTTEFALPAQAGSDDIAGRGLANCSGCGSQWDDDRTAPVASFPANAWGLHDMHGNVWEWVEDCYHESYEGAPDDGSGWGRENGGDCSVRVLRGGSWDDDQDFARSAYRLGYFPDFRRGSIGFRVLCSSPSSSTAP